MLNPHLMCDCFSMPSELKVLTLLKGYLLIPLMYGLLKVVVNSL